jgi:hypothetical protein
MLYSRLLILLPVLLFLFIIGSQSALARLDNDQMQEGFNSVSNVAVPYVKINFQPANAVIPDGYLPDSGARFGNRGNGFRYGWNQTVNDTRDQNRHPDQRYDTFNHMQKQGVKKSWEIAVPNGVYELFLVMGDPRRANQVNSVEVEGTIVSDPDGQDNFDEYQVSVTVNDGRLSIKPADEASNAKIAFVDIFQTQDAPPPPPGETPTPTPEPPSGETPPLFGLEIGINLDTLNSIKAEIAQGLYDRPCSEAEHNSTQWHLLVNPANKCHYDHHHGDDPNYVNDLFGQPGAWFSQPGQSISYPWQTFKAQHAYEPNDTYIATKQMENDLKHEGYLWVVRRNQPCPQPYCVTDFRLQVHAIFGAMDAVVRYHSFSFEARVCQNPNNPASCGIVRNGGWADFGRLLTTDGVLDCGHTQRDFIDLPADTLYFPIDRPEARDEIRCHPILTTLPTYPSDRPIAEWWAHGPLDRRFQLRSFDPLGNINRDDPARWHLYCQLNDPACRYNQSITTVWIGYVLKVPEFHNDSHVRLDANQDGRTDYRGFSDRWGTFVNTCTQPGLDCIPTEFSNVVLNEFPNPEGVFKEASYLHHICNDCPKVDFDLSPPNQQWITWFFRHAMTTHTASAADTMSEPAPTETPLPTQAPPEAPEAEPTSEPTSEPTEEPAAPSDTPEPTTEPADPQGTTGE